MRSTVLFLLFLIVATSPVSAQKRKKKKGAQGSSLTEYYTALPGKLKQHIYILASDSLEGRRTGTRGEQLASDYIGKRFAEAGLAPAGDNNGWLQAFEVNEGRQFEEASTLWINDKKLSAGKDFFPYATSANGKIEGQVSPVLKEEKMPWFLDLKEELEKNKTNPHYDINNYIVQKTAEFGQKNASAVIIYNSSSINDDLKFDAKAHPAALSIPVVYISKDAAAAWMKKESEPVDIKLNLVIGDKKRKGTNVVGMIDNKAASTIILGAHFDHLGYGEDHNSLFTGGAQIHNGADDNASGTASLIELANILKQNGTPKFNYVFIAFSGEELGLYGSKHYTEYPTTDLSKVDYMVNMDMVGRLNDSTHAITIGGYGTSPSWGEIFGSITGSTLTLKFDSSGTGPSDHTSFYRKNIPVLFFFTGTHSDYHKPSDDADKINYNGAAEIIKMICTIIERSAGRDKLVFTKTRETSPGGSATRFTVSLGIMPDYTFTGNGVRVDGVSDGKLAQKLGIQAGDILVKLGDIPVSSVQNYMQALGKFKKGDATKVVVKRGEQEIVYDVNF